MIEKSNEIVYNLIMGDTDYLISMRRALHRMPEPSEKEFQTSDFIAAELSAMGHKFKRLGTGIVCDVKGASSERTIALRCDIDGLPVIEKTDCDFKSDRKSVV